MTLPTYSSKEMLAKLIAFDTTSHKSNLDLIGFVSDYLSSYGVPYDLIHNEDKTKANLYATIGDPVPGGIVLSGHTDVVPVDDQDWASDPFQMTETDGRLYGRGTCDMKGFVATVLAAVPGFVNRPLSRPIHIALSYDEEVGCIGVRPMLEHIVAHLPKPALVIVGEPTSMKVVNAHKALRSFTTYITGVEAHSSQTDMGVSAITAAADLIRHLSEIGEDLRARGDSTHRFDPPFTTLSVGTIEGGTAMNIIPRHCQFTWEHRTLPHEDNDEIIRRFDAYVNEVALPRMKERSDRAEIKTVQLSNSPGLSIEENSPAETLALRLAEQNETFAVSYGTEAGLFQAMDIPTVVCGPGDILQAHKPDEYLSLEQLAACDRFLQKLLDEISA